MWAEGVPYHEFARLCRESPAAWFEEAPPNSGFWSVHRHADIVAASWDVAAFSSRRSAWADGAASAVDVGTLLFDRRVTVRRGPPG